MPCADIIERRASGMQSEVFDFHESAGCYTPPATLRGKRERGGYER